ncbi:MAG: formamidopyrimidine-DNA glycosylase [Acidobacteria bacterium]|nr:formamidopyrimidine-DNA glycosylase [Acidobacteriota bacterium]
MPELPDIVVYVECLDRRITSRRLTAIRIVSPFLLRSVAPSPSEAEGRLVTAVGRLGKRLVVSLEGDLHLVLHLMIAGRLRWRGPGAPMPGRIGLASFDFESGRLLLTEAGTKRRASLHVVEGAAALRGHDPGGIDPVTCGLDAFHEALARENHTLKRALTDPGIFSGIGNAYSDEILHRARLSPFLTTRQIEPGVVARLMEAAREVLTEWTVRLRREAGEGFPEKVTAFREEMSVHGKFGKPCPVCGAAVQRIVYAGNEANYCARCQTGGRLLADRSLSRLLKDDWPRTLDELERRARR